jgi:hypothetical protein
VPGTGLEPAHLSIPEPKSGASTNSAIPAGARASLAAFVGFPLLRLARSRGAAAGVILTGDNAQGKTSILEALCVLVRLHSPRTHRMGTLARIGGGGGFGIAGDPWGGERQVRFAREGLALKVDGEPRANRNAYVRDGGLGGMDGQRGPGIDPRAGRGAEALSGFHRRAARSRLPAVVVALPPRVAGEEPAAQGRPHARCGDPFLRGDSHRARHRADAGACPAWWRISARWRPRRSAR